jgi:hypothetical protein
VYRARALLVLAFTTMGKLRVLDLCLCLLAQTSCSPIAQQPSSSIAELDEMVFRCAVEPILIRSCSYLACHGNPGFPLRVYSIGKLRSVAPRSLSELIQPLTPEERNANFRSAVAFTYGGVRPDDNLLLRKVLPAQDGGFAHKGGAMFSGKSDPRAMTIRAWLAGEPLPCATSETFDAGETG